MALLHSIAAFFFVLLLETRQGKSAAVLTVEGPSKPIQAAVGEDVTFFCHLRNEVSAEDMEVRWVFPKRSSPSLVQVYSKGRCDKQEQDPFFRGRTEVLSDGIRKGIVGLRLKNVQPSDGGTYSCQFQSGATTAEATTEVIVSGYKNDCESEGVSPSTKLICSPKGISFYMDNGMYWSSTPDAIRGNKQIDDSCWFQVCLLDCGRVQITDHDGAFLSLDLNSRLIKPLKEKDGPNSEFNVQYKKGNVLFRTSNGLFMCESGNTLKALKGENDYDNTCFFNLVEAHTLKL